MILLNAVQLTRQFDAEPVLDGVSFEVRPGERIGLVGPNGAGKTTLMQILAGLDEPDEGHLEQHQSARLALLEQSPQFDPERTLLDEAKSGLASLYALQDEALEMADKIAHETDPAARVRWQKRYDVVQHELERLSAFNVDHRVDEILEGLGFNQEQYDRPLTQLSGGQQNRVALARILLAAPDLMLLDEPTNHLDIAATEWLEGYLARCPQAMIVVSHDRYFLDRVTERTLELYAGKVTDYPGNFSAYWKLKDERKKVLERTFEKQQEFIAKTEDFIRKNHYSNHVQAADREKKLERLERVDRPREIPMPTMNFGEPKRTGDWVIDAVEVTKGFGAPLFRDVNLRILRGERVGLFGPNGSGKTTLLRTLLGELEPDAGRVRFGTNVEIAYFDQQLESVDPDLDLIEAVRPSNNPNMVPAQIRDLLARFGLRGEIVQQQVKSLSGGEKSKVALARVAALRANVLVLDEPTNHLDLWARASLEKSLLEFEGTLLFVSHDRYFLDRVSTKLIVFEPARWRLYDGNYSQYQDSMRRARDEAGEQEAAKKSAERAKSTAPTETKPASKRKRQFPYRKVEDLEVEIAKTEARIVELQAELASPAVLRDGAKAKVTNVLYAETQTALARLYEHWEEASELN